jgi:hypothetical protein
VTVVLHRIAVLPTAALAACGAAALFVAVVPAVAIHSHRTRKAHR